MTQGFQSNETKKNVPFSAQHEKSSALASCLKFRHLRSPPGYAPRTLREIARSSCVKTAVCSKATKSSPF